MPPSRSIRLRKKPPPSPPGAAAASAAAGVCSEAGLALASSAWWRRGERQPQHRRQPPRPARQRCTHPHGRRAALVACGGEGAKRGRGGPWRRQLSAGGQRGCSARQLPQPARARVPQHGSGGWGLAWRGCTGFGWRVRTARLVSDNSFNTKIGVLASLDRRVGRRRTHRRARRSFQRVPLEALGAGEPWSQRGTAVVAPCFCAVGQRVGRPSATGPQPASRPCVVAQAATWRCGKPLRRQAA